MIVIATMGGGLLAFADDEKALAEEIIGIQEGLLSAIEPRPTGEAVAKSPLYPELVRRVVLTNRNWKYQKQGEEAAKKARRTLIVLPRRSDVEMAYLALLKETLSLQVVKCPEDLDDAACRFFAYGYNSVRLEQLREDGNEAKLRSLLHEAVAKLGYQSSARESLLFIPNRFEKKFTAGIRGLRTIPHIE